MLNTRGRIRELAVVAVFLRILLPKPPVAVTKRVCNNYANLV